MLILSLLDCIIASTIEVLSYQFPDDILLMVLNKLNFIVIIFWIYSLFIYIINLTFNHNNYVLIKRVFFWVNIVFCALIIVTPLTLIITPQILDATGLPVYILYGSLIMYIILIFICIIVKAKNISKKSKVFPFFLFVFLMIIIFIMRFVYAEIDLVSTAIVLVNLIMYFTIENPDLKAKEQSIFLKREAESASRAKNVFLKNMAHELSTPLNKAKGLNYLNMSSKDKDAVENAKDVDIYLEELITIKDNVIDKIKLDGGSVTLENVVYNPHDMIDKVISLNKNKIEDKKLKFKANIDSKLSTALYGDPDKIKRIIMELLSNAIKYTQKGTITLSIKTKLDKGKCSLDIIVTDTGIGISKKNLKYLFKPFNRIDVEDNITINGMGLGLSNVKQYLELMNGEISVESKKDLGSTFKVLLKQELMKRVEIKDGREF